MSTSWIRWLSFYASNLYTIGLPVLFWIKPFWNIDEMPSQQGKIILITGGNSGTGYATAKVFYEAGARVIIACRSAERAQKAVEDIRKGGSVGIDGIVSYTLAQSPVGEIEYVHLDLSDLSSVEECARRILEKEKKIDILYANAGIMALPPGQYTKQGYSLQFGTNVLGHQRLISLLLPVLQRSSTPESAARLIVLSSAAHNAAPTGGINYDSMKKGDTLLGEWAEYGESKWGDLALAKYVDEKYGPRSGSDRPVVSIAIHPGLVRTNLWSHLSANSIAKKALFLVKLINVSPLTGALNQIWAGAVPDAKARDLSGKYIVPYQIIGATRPDLQDPAKWAELWDWCEAQAARVQ